MEESKWVALRHVADGSVVKNPPASTGDPTTLWLVQIAGTGSPGWEGLPDPVLPLPDPGEAWPQAWEGEGFARTSIRPGSPAITPTSSQMGSGALPGV